MPKDDLRIGLVGYGVIGIAHLDCWSNVSGAKISAVCDVIAERAMEGAQKCGADVYTSYEEMLERAELDAVDICTPSGLHSLQGIAAAERGLHVMTEKPIDIDLAKVDRLIELAEKQDVRLGCIFQYRVGPEARKAKEMIDAGRIGRIISASTYVKWWRAQSYYDSGDWRGTLALDGGVLSNQAIHSIDQLCFIAGPVAHVDYAYVTTLARRIEAEDFAIAALTFESGARGVIEATTCSYPGMATRTEVFGELGSVVFDGPNVVALNILDEKIDFAAEVAKVDGRDDPKAIGLDGHTAQLQDFVYAIREGRDPVVSGRDARVSIDALTKVYEKAGAPKLGVTDTKGAH